VQARKVIDWYLRVIRRLGSFAYDVIPLCAGLALGFLDSRGDVGIGLGRDGSCQRQSLCDSGAADIGLAEWL